jgi:hypothetical protein
VEIRLIELRFPSTNCRACRQRQIKSHGIFNRNWYYVRTKGDFTVKRSLICLMTASSLVTVLLYGCVLRPVEKQDQIILPETGRHSIAVMPFLKGLHDSSVDEAIDRTLDCPLAELCFDTGDVMSGAEENLTRYMQAALEDRLGERMIPLGKTLTIYEALTKDQAADSPRSLAIRLGKELRAAHIVAGTVWRYRERTGTARASASPASVAFVVYIINVADGRRLWKGTHFETQKPLSQSIFEVRTFFKRGARWLTVDELARYGIDEIVEQLPYGP